MAQVLSITDIIAQSKRASAVERAWEVAKALEGDRVQVDGLQWVEPEQVAGRGITRRVDFSKEFAGGVEYVTPVPLNIGVIAPASRLVPGEDLQVNWTMPILTRMSQYEGTLDAKVSGSMGFYKSPSMRHMVDAVSFLPFPRADATADESFSPEFMVALEVDAAIGKPDNYFAVVARYNNRVIKQMVTGGLPKLVQVYAEPLTQTHFKASMLVNLSADELTSTPDDAGELEIFLYRITKGGFTLGKEIDYGTGGLSDVVDFPGSSAYGAGPMKGADSFDFTTRGGGYKGLSALPSLPQRPTISPAAAVKEVGDVKLGEGERGQRVESETLSGYVGDTEFGVQPIRIRFLGVREASQDAARGALHEMAQRY